MRRVGRYVFTIGAAVSLLLCVGVCVLWVRGWSEYDHVAWTYDRYLADRSAASNQVYLTSDKRVWLDVNWGRVGPFNGQLVWGYYVNADQSGGRPQLRFRHERYDEMETFGFPKADVDGGTRGWGRVRWVSARRSRAKDGDDFRYIRIGVSHWVLAVALAVVPMIWVKGFRKRPRARALGMCGRCGYDLRATPERCPECGEKTRHG